MNEIFIYECSKLIINVKKHPVIGMQYLETPPVNPVYTSGWSAKINNKI